MRIRPLYAGLAVAALAFGVGVAGATTVVFSDDFSTDTPVTGTDVSHPELQEGDVGKRWMIRTPTIPDTTPPEFDPDKLHYVQVRDDDPVNPPNNHLKLERIGPADWGYAHAQLTDQHSALTQGNEVTINFSLFLSTDQAGSTTSDFRVFAHPLNTIGDAQIADFVPANNAFQLRFLGTGADNNQKALLFVGGAVVPDSTGTATYTYGEWNDVVVHADYGEKTFFVEITNPTLGTTTSAMRTFSGDFDLLGTVQFAGPGNATLARLDNVLVTVDADEPPLLPGDANRDGRVDGEDFLIWQASFGVQEGATWDDGDFNGDGRVDGEDFLIWQAHFGSVAGSSSVTPEPAAVALLGLAGLLLRRRRAH